MSPGWCLHVRQGKPLMLGYMVFMSYYCSTECERHGLWSTTAVHIIKMANVPSTGTQVSGNMLRGKACRSLSLHETTTADNTMDRQVQQTKHTAMLFTHACALTSTHSSNLVYIIALCMVKSISNMEHASGHIPTSSAVRSSMEQSLPRDARESMYGLWGKAGICASTYALL